MNPNQNICDVIRAMETKYNDKVSIGDYVDFSMHETLQHIQAYINGRHISGKTDSQGYDKPFDDIITEAVNARERATDIDVSSINFIAPTNKYVIATEIFKVAVQQWMQEENFGLFLNEYGRALAIYNSIIIKAVEKYSKEDKKDELCISLVNWNNVLVDPIDIEYAPIVERMYLTEAELYERYDFANVEELTTTRRKLIGQKEVTANDNDYYEIYEAHSEEYDKKLKKSVYKMYVVSFLTTKGGENKDFILYEGKEEKCPYILAHLVPPDGRTLSRGVVEQLFDKQWLVNHYTYITKKTLDFSTKIGFQTSSKAFTGMNAMNDFDTGDILVTEDNKPLTQINTQSYNLVSNENAKAETKSSARTISGVSEAMAGEVKSGAAWRQTEALLTESKDLFNKMKEHKSLYIQELFKEFIIPFILKQMDTTKEITAILDSKSIEKIDTMFITSEAVRRANEKAAKIMLENANKSLDEMQTIGTLDIQGEAQNIKDNLKMQGNQRFFKVSDIDDKSWGEYFKDFDTKIIIDITGESTNTQQNVDTLNKTMNTLLGAGLPISNPNVKLILSNILRQTSGISPLDLSDMEQQPQPQNPPLAQA